MKKNTLLILTLVGLTSCFSPNEYKNRDQIVASMSDSIEKQNKDIPSISVVDEFPSDTLFIDVRTDEEMAVSMLPGAISQAQFEDQFSNHHQKSLIVYDTIGMRSNIYAKKLKRQGLKVYNLKGGLLAWAHAKKPFFKDGKETTKVHVHAESWNLLPEGLQGVYK